MLLGIGQARAQSFVFTNTQSASPIAAFTTVNVITNIPNPNVPAVITSTIAPSTVSGYQFTHWTVGGVRIEDITGRAANPVTIVMSNANVSAVANYTPVASYTGDLLVPDWFKLEYYGSALTNATSDTDADGFDLATEYFRGYHPRVFNELVEGGVSRRRRETLVVLTSTNYARVTVLSEPAGITNGFAVVTNTGSITLPSQVSYTGYTFIGWFVDTNRMDSPQGLSLNNLSFTITNDVTFVAKFVLSTLDSDGDGLLDGYELYNFNTLTNTLASDPDGDGFSIAVENFRSYSPQVFNELVEGGVSRRRSETIFFVPTPPDFTQQPANRTNVAGTDVTLSVVGHGIGTLTYQWRLNGVTLVGATNATLIFTNAQFTNSGSFSVVITSPYGATNSAPATVIVNDGTPGFNLVMTDAFPGPLFTDASRTGLASNEGATRQTGEPFHGGKLGTNSVWLTWRAPTSGIARVSTLGSGFDTLLGIYTGDSVSALERVASDDDSGGFYTSALVFNATGGVEYRLAVDGLAGATGNVMVSWALEATSAEVPRITAQPTGRTVAPGARVPLQVQVVSVATPSYQWFKNGQAVPDANRDRLVLENVSFSDAGLYQVAVWIGVRTNWSEPASLQISTLTEAQAKDKLAELFASTNNVGQQALSAGKGASRTLLSFTAGEGLTLDWTAPTRKGLAFAPINISLGTPEMHVFNNYGSRTDKGELGYGGKYWFATDNQLRTPTVDGVLLVDSRSASVEMLLAITEYLPVSPYFGKQWFATNSSPGVCRLAVPVKGGTNYYVTWCTTATSPVQFTNDIALVDGTLKILQQPADAAIATGGSTQLRVLAAAQGTASGGTSIVPLEDLRYQWRKDGTVISGATAPALTAASAGTYSVVVTNSLGSVTSSNAVVTIATPVSIISQPVTAAAILGGSASFAVTTAGSAPLFYRWFRNGVGIPGATGPTHLNDSVGSVDAGSYLVVISNAVNVVTSSVASLTVLIPPQHFHSAARPDQRRPDHGHVYSDGGGRRTVELSMGTRWVAGGKW